MSDRLTSRERQELDRWITGNYGEDSTPNEDNNEEEFIESPDEILDDDYGPDNSDIEDESEDE